jgi:hypothetical protein
MTIMKKIISGLAFLVVLSSCSNSASKNSELQAKQYTIDSLKAVASEKEAENKVLIQKQAVRNAAVIHQQNSSTATPVTQEPAKKKGWSNTAKGAVIGGVVGAGTGVAVSKNKVKGGIIGAVVGAGAGAGVGAIIDKKKKD